MTPIFIHKRNIRRGQIICCESKPSGVASTPRGARSCPSGAPLEDCPPPREVVIPLLQHIGKPCTPLVKAGDHVDMGQKIGDGEGLCVPVHASVSGTVKAVEPRSHPSGQPHLAVVIENDFQNTYHSAVPPCADTDALDADALIRRIREAGLVGMGGATFPTDIKANIGKVETLIANACECEPYITADDALLCTDADQAIRGLRLLRRLLKPRRTVIAIEDNKERAVSILTDKLKQQDEVELVVLPTRYPQGRRSSSSRQSPAARSPPADFPRMWGVRSSTSPPAPAYAGPWRTGSPSSAGSSRSPATGSRSRKT